MSKDEVGCCGAYCRTCRAWRVTCKGCRTGYESGERDIRKARCRTKVCCLTKAFATCADCSKFDNCATLSALHGKPGYKYGKYRQALEYIRKHGYDAFVEAAGRWTNPYGRYPS